MHAKNAGSVFSEMKDLLTDMRTRLDGVEKRLEDKIRERELVEYAALPRTEVLSNIADRIDLRAQRYEAQIRENLAPAFKQEFDVNTRLALLTLPSIDLPIEHRHTLSDAAFCYLFGDVLKVRFAETLERMEWPGPEGLPKAERAERLAALDQEIESLEAEKFGLLNEIRAGGFEVQELDEPA